MIETMVFDVGETITRDDRYWASWADWLGVPRHTLSALVGAVVARGQDNAEAVRLARPGVDIAAEYQPAKPPARASTWTRATSTTMYALPSPRFAR